MRALAEIGDHRAIPIMMKVMEEGSSLLQYWAKEGLSPPWPGNGIHKAE
ncbi:MAG: hypothetical protein MZV64_17965 [Ignavibacteriales bacterium]|nr:hypothetical protein [Ignavibacteriales bacterium]